MKSNAASRRLNSYTLQPCAARHFAVARPMPLEPPVRMTTFICYASPRTLAITSAASSISASVRLAM